MAITETLVLKFMRLLCPGLEIATDTVAFAT